VQQLGVLINHPLRSHTDNQGEGDVLRSISLPVLLVIMSVKAEVIGTFDTAIAIKLIGGMVVDTEVEDYHGTTNHERLGTLML
jgi:hypothetical protein